MDFLLSASPYLRFMSAWKCNLLAVRQLSSASVAAIFTYLRDVCGWDVCGWDKCGRDKCGRDKCGRDMCGRDMCACDIALGVGSKELKEPGKKPNYYEINPAF